MDDWIEDRFAPDHFYNRRTRQRITRWQYERLREREVQEAAARAAAAREAAAREAAARRPDIVINAQRANQELRERQRRQRIFQRREGRLQRRRQEILDRIRRQANRIRIRAPGPPPLQRGYARINISRGGPYLDYYKKPSYTQHEFDAGTASMLYDGDPYDYDGPEDLAFGVCNGK